MNPSDETVAQCVQNAAAIGSQMQNLLARSYRRDLPNDPEVTHQLQQAGRQVIPGIRVQEAIETVAWACNGSSDEFARYVRQMYAEDRIDRHESRTGRTATSSGNVASPAKVAYAETLGYMTLDGHAMSEFLVSCYIGASMPTPEQDRAAVQLLIAALKQGITRDALWNLSRVAVWKGLSAAQEVLTALSAASAPTGAPATAVKAPRTYAGGLQWADDLDWDGDEPPPSVFVPDPTAAAPDDFGLMIAQFSLF